MAFVSSVYRGSIEFPSLDQFYPFCPLWSVEWNCVARDSAVDGTVKLLLEARDGAQIEAVLVPMRTYTTLCLSSQVGCGRGCRFCETAALGLSRNLDAKEIIDQVRCARDLSDQPVRNLVFMGMGEATDNLPAVLEAVETLTRQVGGASHEIAPGRVTLSTVGNVKGIEELAAARRAGRYRQLRLAVSLNSVQDSVRSSLMPINSLFPLEELRRSLLDFPLYRTRDRIVIGYVLIPGVNDSGQDARDLSGYLQGIPAIVNLIPHVPRAGSTLPGSNAGELKTFRNYCVAQGLTVRYRNSRGAALAAGCGQLGARRGSGE